MRGKTKRFACPQNEKTRAVPLCEALRRDKKGNENIRFDVF